MTASTTGRSRTGLAPAPAVWVRTVPVLAVVLLVALAAGLAAADASGATTPWLLVDPGPMVRWGVVVAGIVVDLASASTVGLLVMAAVGFPSPDGERVFRQALVTASATATIWAAFTFALLVLRYAEITGRSIGDSRLSRGFMFFAIDVSIGRGMTITLVLAAFIGLVAAGVESYGATALLAVSSLLALVPRALGGHSADSSGHETGVTALGLHLLGISVWVGGLAALLLLLPSLGSRASATAAARFSTLAGWSFAAVAASGLIVGWLRLGRWDGLVDGLSSSYGVIMIVKTLLLVALGAAGWWHRKRTLKGLAAGRPRMFVRLAVVEVTLMGVAVGLGAALARTPPPIRPGAGRDLTPAQVVTGYPLPPAPALGRWLTTWQPDLLWLVLVGVGLALYGVGVRRTAARGDGWPVARTLSWVLGLVVLGYVTCGAPAAYGRVTFSGHVVMHMLLTMVAPALLALGAPVTLAMSTLTARTDGTRGPREWLRTVLDSAALRVLAFAPVAATILAVSLVAFYWTGLFELALTTHLGHEVMLGFFLLVGYLLAWSLIGPDALPRRPVHPMRLVLSFAMLAFFSFFGAALALASGPLHRLYFIRLEQVPDAELLDDQRFAGNLAWAISATSVLVLALVLVVQWSSWSSSDARTRPQPT